MDLPKPNPAAAEHLAEHSFTFPISVAQRRLWFLDQMVPGNPAYNVTLAVRIHGVLNITAMARALDEIVARHESLRTTFEWHEGEPVQIVSPEGQCALPVIDLSAVAESEREPAARSLVSEEQIRPFDLQKGPLLRARMILLAPEEHVLILSMHHIISDGWSLRTLLRELCTLYEDFAQGRPASLGPLPIQFADFVLWQRERMQADSLAKDLSYWTVQLKDLEPLQLPTDHPRPAIQSSHGARMDFSLPGHLSERLRKLSRSENVTSFVTLLTAYMVLLHRHTQQQDISVGTPFANRVHTETQGLIGFFASTLVLRGNLSGDPTFRDLLQRIRKTTLDGFHHQDIPFEKLVEVLQPDRDISRNPLFQVAFELETDFSKEVRFSGLRLSPFLTESITTRVDLETCLVDAPDGFAGTMIYNTDLFDKERVGGMVAHFEVLLQGIVEHPETRLSQLPLLTDGERQQLLVDWNATDADYPKDRCVTQLFESQAALHPDNLAVATSQKQWSFRELNEKANQLANYLKQRGVGPEVLVCVCVQRCVEMVMGLLAVLKAGGAYVPLDPDYPAERLAFMLEDAAAPVLLTEKGLLHKLPKTSAEVICLDERASQVAVQSKENPAPEVKLHNLAYVIYTSGSTGRPKGVAIEYGGLLNLIHWHQRVYQVSENDRVTQLSAQSFDASVWELWPNLTMGASIHIPDEEVRSSPAALVKWLAAEKITRTFLPTPLAEAALELELPGNLLLKIMSTAGDRLHRAPQQNLSFRLMNHYGPTEYTVAATYCEVRPYQAGVPVIGRPISNTQVYVLDGAMQPVPVGIAGEMYLGGASLARGYHRRPDLTAERFVAHPFSTDSGARLYKTGDLVRYRADGNLEFLGRADQQVKIRGFRIEPGEIAAVLEEHKSIRQAIVLVEDDSKGERQLVAYVVLAQAGLPAISELRQHLKSKLPHYMIPAAFVTLEHVPLSPNGKVNLKALSALDRASVESPDLADEPGTDLERTIADIWREYLGIQRVGRTDNFFDLGGHSLLIAKIHQRLRATLGRELSIVDLFRYPTVAGLAAFLDQRKEAPPPSSTNTRTSPQPKEPIAIVAMAGRFAGASNVEEFWANLRNGVESVRFFTTEELILSGVDPEALKDPNYVKSGSVLEDAAEFDARFFGVSPREAQLMDPQHRIFLESAQEALERAACDPQRYTGRIGVFAGARMSSYLLNNLHDNPSIADASAIVTTTGNNTDSLPARVAYKLNLRGPAVNVQTTCSTSLVAVHLACQSLLSGDCDLALAGGAGINFPQGHGYHYQEEGILSPDGHCRAFDAKAQGTILGNGVALVVLKRLSDAEADGNSILAVIKGSAVNNDGSQKVGFTAPSVAGQAEVISAAQSAAGVAPDTITYVETHGTGTQLGDPIEIAALTQAFQVKGANKTYCALGSVKTNIGHLDAAAGVAGLVKTVLQLQHKELVPSLHFEKPSPKIDFKNGPFYVNTQLRAWDSQPGVPRRAGVSSFGIGGTNAHVVLEEAPPRRAGKEARGWQLLTVSAKTPSALEQAKKNLANHLLQDPNANLADVAYTHLMGRGIYPQRWAMICRTREQAIAALHDGDSAQVFVGEQERTGRPVVFLFPGQGSQYVNMGRELYESELCFRREIDNCSTVLAPLLGLDLRSILYPTTGQEAIAAEQLRETRITQPALFVVEYALAQLWAALGVRPQAMIGHSLGEYVAATIAGVFDLPDALGLVALRGRLMQSMDGGAMLAVLLAESDLVPVLPSELNLAAVNAPDMCVVSGPTAAIAKFETTLVQKGIEGRRLHTSHAFHSAMMDSILEEFRAAVANSHPRPPAIPIVSNLAGVWLTPESAVDPGYWVKHLRQPVRFGQGVAELLSDRNRVYIEVGPGNTLAGLIRRQVSSRSACPVFPSLRHPNEKTGDVDSLGQSFAKLWIAGANIDGEALYAGQHRVRLALPTYPFERQKYWIDPPTRDSSSPLKSGKKPDLADWFYLPVWQRTTPIRWQEFRTAAPSRCLLFAEDSGVAQAIVAKSSQQGHDIISVYRGDAFARLDERSFSLRPSAREDYDALLHCLRERGWVPDRILHTWLASTEAAANDFLSLGFQSLLSLAQALEAELAGNSVEISVVTAGLQNVLGDESICPDKATVLGLCTVIPQEYPHLRCHAIDVDPGDGPDRIAANLISETYAGYQDPLVAHRKGYRWLREFKSVRLPATNGAPLPLRQYGVYLITGGTRGAGLEIARYLGQKLRARLVLVGRTELPARAEWNHIIKNGDAELSQRLEKLLELERSGIEFLPLVADVTNFDEVASAIQIARKKFGEINGVIHAAGVSGGTMILRETPQLAQHVLSPKLEGTKALRRALHDADLDFFLSFSSQRGVLGGPGQASYCGANAFLDSYAEAHAGSRRPLTISVAWDTWSEVGMAARSRKLSEDAAVAAQFQNGAISNREGIAAFERILVHPLPVVIVSTEDFPSRVEQFRKTTVTTLLAEAEKQRGSVGAAAHARPELRTAYVPPRNPVESALASIWQKLLAIEKIGVEDNFFELGGDSVLSLQLTSRARQAGLSLTPKQVFQHQTIAELAAAVDHGDQTSAEQGLVTGPVALTPIQKWFFEKRFVDSRHYNQSVMLELRRPVPEDHLRTAVGALVNHHDALRMRYEQTDHAWRQRCAGAEDPAPFSIRDFTAVSDTDFAQTITNAAEEIQASLDLTLGPLARFVLFNCGAERPQRLLVVIHHLVIDVVSWRVVLEDFETALGQLADGHTIQLPAKTTSFKQWAEHLTSQVAAGAFDAQLEYWQSQGAEQIKAFPVDTQVPRTEETEATVEIIDVSLTAEETRTLLQEIPSVYNAHVNDALLTALAEAIGEWTGEKRIRVDLEGMGRETPTENLDLSRTVGWFTALYPVVIDTQGVKNQKEALARVKELLRRIPNRGLGYGALRYLSAKGANLANLPQSEICFLYQGHNLSTSKQESILRGAMESSGNTRSPRAQLAYRLAIIAAVMDGALRVTWMFSGTSFRRETITQIANNYISSLRGLIDACPRAAQITWDRESAKLFGWTPSQTERIACAIEQSNGRLNGEIIESVSPLSSMQAGMLFHTLLAPEAGEYSKRACCILQGDLNVEDFQLAWQQVVVRHSVLRTSLVWEGVDFPVQVVHRGTKLSWELRDFSSLPPAQREAKQERYLQEDDARGFLFSGGPLMRMALLRMDNDCYTFVWSFHHILIDGWSIVQALQEAFVRYDALQKGKPITVTPALRFQQFVAWLRVQDAAKAETFWREYLRGIELPTSLAVDRPMVRNQAHFYKEVRVELDPDLTGRLRSLALSQRVTLNTVLQGAWAILLSRYSGQSDVLFGTTVAGRSAPLPEIESAIGLFINTLPVRVSVNPDASVGSWLSALQHQQSEAREYEWTSLLDIHKWSGFPATQPLFESLLVFENYPASGLSQRIAGLDLHFTEPSERTSFPLTVVASLTDPLFLTFAFDSTRFDEEAVRQMVGHFRSVLESMPGLSASPLRMVRLLTSAEVREITVQWNDTATDWETTELVPQLLERQAARTPDLLAVRFEETDLTYSQLNERTNQLTNFLRARGAARGTLVGVCMERSIEMVVALVSVMKAGAAYVPLDPDYPSERLRFMIADSDAPLLLTQNHLLERLSGATASTIALDSHWDAIARENSASLSAEIFPDDLAYVIYTSGSTGQPKGAMNTHRGLANRLLWMQREYALTYEDRVMQKTPFSFDVSVWEFFWPLMTGASVIVPAPGGHRDPKYLAELISREKVTTLHFVPSMLRAFLQDADTNLCRSLNRVICSGESLTADLQAQFFARFNCELHNLYGPTEASIDVTSWKCSPESSGASVPIGRPIANTQLYILDQELNPVPPGVPGELHIGGFGLARGYWRRPDLTAEKFIPDPFRAAPGARLYKTGDLARYRADGAIEYLGRVDFQVKIRGQRIELGEIEAALKDFPGIRESVVTAREDSSSDKCLIAYLVTEANANIPIPRLRNFMKDRVPEFMVPSAFVFLDSLPLGPNGKLDRRALPAPEQTRPELESCYVEPSTPEEIVLARIWAGVLDVDKIGAHDNFFELGGHSLLALQMLSRVRELFEIDLPLRSLFEAPTIRQLKETILRLEQSPGRVAKIARVFLTVDHMSEEEVSAVLQQKSAAAG